MGISTHLGNCAQAYLAQFIIMHSLRSLRLKLPEGNRKIRIISRAICEQRKLAEAGMRFLWRNYIFGVIKGGELFKFLTHSIANISSTRSAIPCQNKFYYYTHKFISYHIQIKMFCCCLCKVIHRLLVTRCILKAPVRRADTVASLGTNTPPQTHPIFH